MKYRKSIPKSYKIIPVLAKGKAYVKYLVVRLFRF